MNKKLFRDFKVFCGPYIQCGDIDPVYPVLKKVHELRGIPQKSDDAIWHTFLYFIWYHLGSAERLLSQYPHVANIVNLSKTDTGLERRGFRGDIGAHKAAKLINYFVDYCVFSSLDEWMMSLDTWTKMYDMVMQLPQCGTWAAYKWCDLMKNVHGYNISATNIGYGGGGEHAGPVPGMVELTEQPWKECAMNTSLQLELYLMCKEEGIQFNGMEQMETALCDFNSMLHGHYYIGHDIDKQMEHVADLGYYWTARSQVFPRWSLGEHNGYLGVRKNLLTHYQRTGQIYLPSTYKE